MNDKDNLIVFINEHIKSGSEKLRFFNLLDKYAKSLQLRKTDVMQRNCKSFGCVDPDNSGQCIYCGKILDND